jgi:hypothetical protein
MLFACSARMHSLMILLSAEVGLEGALVALLALVAL